MYCEWELYSYVKRVAPEFQMKFRRYSKHHFPIPYNASRPFELNFDLYV